MTFTRNQKKRWSPDTLIRLEQYCLSDAQEDFASLEERDRSIGRAIGADKLSDGEALRQWMEHRQSSNVGLGVGRWVGFSLKTVLLLALVIGVLTGLAATALVLRYDGSVPVNVSMVWGVLIAPQLILLIGLLLVMVMSLLSPRSVQSFYSIPAIWVQTMALGFGHWLQRTQNSSSEKREEMEQTVRTLKKAVAARRDLLTCYGFEMVQRFGVGFNIAAIVYCSLILLFTDRAFGWQSSLIDDAQRVHGIVEWFSFPWSWLLTDDPGRLTLEQIEGSRTVLRDVTQPLMREHLVAWWPFLMGSLVSYGLLPRMFVWFLAAYRCRRILEKPEFRAWHHRMTLDRMRSFTLTTSGRVESSTGAQTAQRVENISFRDDDCEAYVLWLTEELCNRYQVGSIRTWIEQVGRLRILSDKVTPNIATVPELVQENSVVLLPVEGWQPPIQEMIRALDAAAGGLATKKIRLHLFLLGKPSADRTPEALSAAMEKVWVQKVSLLGNDNLFVRTSPVQEYLS